MDDNAKRMHSIKRLVWTLGIVNVVALLLVSTIPPYILGAELARSLEIRSQTSKTENEQLLLLTVDGLRDDFSTAMLWIVVLLITQIVGLVVIDLRLARELRIGQQPERETDII
ncbi:MAG: hypothetical protein ABL309_03915 [Phycisphaerales bacterium]